MNPYEARKLATRMHQVVLVRLAVEEQPTSGVHKVLIQHYVWCDVHCEIHKAEADFYGESQADCRDDNWRSVFVASMDPNEEF